MTQYQISKTQWRMTCPRANAYRGQAMPYDLWIGILMVVTGTNIDDHGRYPYNAKPQEFPSRRLTAKIITPGENRRIPNRDLSISGSLSMSA
jgi:hypothetical protein